MSKSILSDGSISLPQVFPKKVQGIYDLRTKSGDLLIFIRSETEITCFKYFESNNNFWQKLWTQKIYKVDGNYSLKRYPWLVTNNLLPDKELLIIKHPSGIQFYEITESGLKLLKEDGSFHDVYGFKVLLGNFYPSKNNVGLMTSKRSKDIKFYLANEQSFEEDEDYPFFPLTKPPSFTPNWFSNKTDFFTTKLTKNEYESIGLFSTNNLEFFQFTSILNSILKTNQITKSKEEDDTLFFGNITNQKYQDILHLNKTGLFLYQYDDFKKDYVNLHKHFGFTSSNGWLPNYTETVRLLDVNNDLRDDLIFSGSNGITALTFNSSSNDWESLLTSENVQSKKRFSNIVAILPKNLPLIKNPSIFTQDNEGNIYFDQITTTEIEKVTEKVTVNAEEVATESPKRILIPEQIARKNLRNKPIWKWAEQWGKKYLLDAIAVSSGQINIKVPLFDISSITSWRLESSLNYNGQTTESDLAGVGWTITLTGDYIYVDYQKSVIPEDFNYYLMIRGQAQLLKLVKDDEEIQSFQLPKKFNETLVTIQYHKKEEYWCVEGDAEKSIYGKSENAKLWSLGWKNWRGLGRDQSQLQPLISAWYLNQRLDKHNRRSLNYKYEIDTKSLKNDKSYSTGIRLNQIIDDNENVLFALKYLPKTEPEFEKPNPVNEQGYVSFPLTLVQSHYLEETKINSDVYSQTLSFNYSLKGGKRYLNTISQKYQTSTEQIFAFDYENDIIKNLKFLPKNLSVNLAYESVLPEKPFLGPNNVLSYSTREKTRLSYGKDYAVITYSNVGDSQLYLRFLSRQMTKTISELELDAKVKINDYILRAYENTFFVFVHSDNDKSLYLFKRDKDTKTWSNLPEIFNFSSKTSVNFSENLIITTEPDQKYIEIFEPTDDKYDWNKIKFLVNRPMKSVITNKNIMIGYDDNSLWLIYKNSKSQWQSDLLTDLNRLETTNKETISRFDLSPEIKNQLSFALKESLLQIHNNFIVLSALEEKNGQLSIQIHLFLIDRNKNIIQKQYFKIDRENLYEIKRESKSEDGTFIRKIGYRLENGLFKPKIVDIYGSAFDKITNKNKRQDAREDEKKRLNEDENFMEASKKYFLPDWNLYSVQISEIGVHCGNDTLLQTMGEKWEKITLKSTGKNQTTKLGNEFVLEAENNQNKLSFKLRKQDENQILHEIKIDSVDQLINRYPAYIAYHPRPDLLEVIAFFNNKTNVYTFDEEKFLPESDWQNLISIKKSIINVRPVSTLIPIKSRLVVKQLTFDDGEFQRITGYRNTFSNNKKELLYSEKLLTIPGDNRKLYGWCETDRSYNIKNGEVIKTQRWFNADGSEAKLSEEKETNNNNSNDSDGILKTNDQMLFDRSGKLIIANLSPYKLSDQMFAYYGFESYENDNLITQENKWIIKNGEIVKGKFSMLGQNYLQLTNSAFMENTLEPRDQQTIYTANCWIRSNIQITLNDPLPYFKAVIKTKNQIELITLLAQAKNVKEDWFYLEIKIDFQDLRKIYQSYLEYNQVDLMDQNVSLPSSTDVNFLINLRIESFKDQIILVDHIRFSPLIHDFSITVYDPTTSKITALIQSNGLIIRNIYNRYNSEIANVNEDGRIEKLTTFTTTGNLNPKSLKTIKIKSKPSLLILEPEFGYYETFTEYSFRTRWKIDDGNAWEIAPGQLWHKLAEKHEIKSIQKSLTEDNVAIRCYVALEENNSFISFHWSKRFKVQLIRKSDEEDVISLVTTDGNLIHPLPSSGEIVILLEKTNAYLWFDGVLILDQKVGLEKYDSSSDFSIQSQGNALIEDLFVMNNIKVIVEYFNNFDDKIQEILLGDSETAFVSESLYDELGREAIKIKTTLVNGSENQSLLEYRSGFVTNKIPHLKGTVWDTGKIEGESNLLNPLDQGYPYTRFKYGNNPLNEVNIVGLPGFDFSIDGRYVTKISDYSNIAFLDNIFPFSLGYRQKVEQTPHGSKKVSVYDRDNNQVAKFVRIPGDGNRLSTYEYDLGKRLIKILPPLYHEKVESFLKATPWQSDEKFLTDEEKKWQKLLGTFFKYNQDGSLRRKITPENGITEYLYNSSSDLRFIVSLDEEEKPRQIIFLNHDSFGQLSTSGYMTKMLPLSTLKEYLDVEYIPNARTFHKFNYAEDQTDPILRGRVKYCVTLNQGEPVSEKLRFNDQQQIISKSSISLSEDEELSEYNVKYVNGKIDSLIYPVKVDGKTLSLKFTYNKIGQLSALGTEEERRKYIDFGYLATGELASERYLPDDPRGFKRYYTYNSPGFLQLISDPFLKEEITYTKDGYGQKGYGDGLVMKTGFNATWSKNADPRWFQVFESDLTGNFVDKCLKALKRTGLINSNNEPLKLFVRGEENTLPLVCNKEAMAKVLAAKQKPSYYGHRYSYGSHQELVKAKYFTEDSESLLEPLQSNTFSKEIPNLTETQSLDIWKLLVNSSYVLADEEDFDPANSIGKEGKSFLKSAELYEDIKNLNRNYIVYVKPIEQLIIESLSNEVTISTSRFEEIFLQWEHLDQNSSILLINNTKKIASEIAEMLTKKGYLPIEKNQFGTVALSKNFTNLLSSYADSIPKIVKVLSKRFKYALGECAFDVESFEIDPNGNHKLFNTGFNRFQLTYRNSYSNQIDNIKLYEKTFAIKHDQNGNIIQALHKGIENIEYHPLSQRPIKIELVDGKKLRFYYDAQGERILKRVFDKNGRVSYEMRYLRDEQGRVLVDKKTIYLSEGKEETVTAYVYGSRGLLAFFRNNRFYSVTIDHAGSVRLIIENGGVVAAYDYLPYGELMRSFGNDPQAHIVYRYTGQEFDEETGLYNYHARLYDPSIGRFYQPDPKAQYFTPYKYAGNSPISAVDPDGEFAILLTFIIVGAVVGAYLGGATANNRWNPVDWDLKDTGTWIGIGGGAFTGAMLPVGFAATAGYVGVTATVLLGSGGAYLSAAVANKNQWNPIEWEWKRPKTWNSLFEGFGTGSDLIGTVTLAHTFAKSSKLLTAFSNVLKINRNISTILFLGVTYSGGGLVAYFKGVKANEGKYEFWLWNLSSPETWSELLQGFETGAGWPKDLSDMSRGIFKTFRFSYYRKSYSLITKNSSKFFRMKVILKNYRHPLHNVVKTAFISYMMGAAANEDLDITRWKLASFSNYEGYINSVFKGKEIALITKNLRYSKLKKNFKTIQISYDNLMENFATVMIKTLNDLDNFRFKKQFDILMEMLFRSVPKRQTKLKAITDKYGESEAKEVSKFFENGLEKWKNREIVVPSVLKKFLSQDARKLVENSVQTERLNQWKIAEENTLKKQKQFFLETIVDFLTCQKGSKRKKRGLDTKIKCAIPSTSSSQIAISKPELIELLLKDKDPGVTKRDEFQLIKSKRESSEGFDSGSPKGFAQHFSLVLNKTPNVLAPSKPSFFPNLILGSIYAIPNQSRDLFTKKETVKIFSFQKNVVVSCDILRTVFKMDDDVLVIKQFFTDPSQKDNKYSEDLENHFKSNFDSNSKLSNVELDDLSKQLGMKGNFKIVEHLYFINTDNLLWVKESVTYKSKYEGNSKTTEGMFQKFEGNNNLDLDKHLDNLSNSDSNVVVSEIETVSKKILDLYHENCKKFGFDRKSEAAVHGFFYGILSLNFKYKNHLDIYVERISGKGYADLIFLSRKGNNNNKSWDNVPIIIEFKADSTSTTGAIDQIKNTGYFYNIGLRTTADKVVMVGINPNAKKGEKAIQVEATDIPKSEGFLNPIVENVSSGKKKEMIEEDLIQKLQHVYYSYSPLALKSADNYIPRLLLGELLSTTKIKDSFILKPNNQITTYVFKYENSDNWIMLNYIDSNKKSKDVYVFNEKKEYVSNFQLPENLKIKKLTQIDVSVNSKSELGWSFDRRNKDTKLTEKKYFFFQDVKISNIDPTSLTSTKDFNRLDNVDKTNFFIKDNLENEIKKVAEISFRIKSLINSESDFQAVLHGLFLNYINENNPHKTIKVLPEANLSKAGRIDLLILEREDFGPNVPKRETLLLVEIKYSTSNTKPELKLKEGNDQIEKYVSNLKSVTDSVSITPVTIVFNKKGTSKDDILYYEVLNEKLISHTSNPKTNSQKLQDLLINLDYYKGKLSSGKLDVATFHVIKSASDDISKIMDKVDQNTFYDKLDEVLAKIKDYEIELELSKLDTNIFNNPNKITSINDKLSSLRDDIIRTLGFDPNDGPPTKKLKPGYRRKRSANLTELAIEKREDFIEFEGGLNEETDVFDETSAMKNRLSFWPFKFIKTVSLSLKSNEKKDQKYNDNSNAEFLKVGDQFVKSTDFNSLLTLGLVLVRKLTGYKPKHERQIDNHQGNVITLDIQSFNLLEIFQKVATEKAGLNNVESYITEIFDDSRIYYSSLKIIRDELRKGELKNIPKLLFKHLKLNMRNFNKNDAVDEFLTQFLIEIPSLEEEFLEYEKEFYVFEDRRFNKMNNFGFRDETTKIINKVENGIQFSDFEHQKNISESLLLS